MQIRTLIHLHFHPYFSIFPYGKQKQPTQFYIQISNLPSQIQYKLNANITEVRQHTSKKVSMEIK
jgi:hypothetical protein